MVEVNRRLIKLRFSMHFCLQLVNRQFANAGLTAPTFIFCDWLSEWLKLNRAAIRHCSIDVFTQLSLMALHCITDFVITMTPTWHLPTWCILSRSFVTANFDSLKHWIKHHHIPEMDFSVAIWRVCFAQINLTSYMKDRKNKKTGR